MAQKQRQSQRGKASDHTSSITLFQDHLFWKGTLALIVLAYVLVISIRFIWLAHVWDQPDAYWQGQVITNNQDSVYFACTLQKAVLGMHQANEQVPGVLHHGMITALPYAILKVFPVSIEALIITMGPLISSLIVIPIVLIGRLYGSVTWGFLAAVLGGIAISYFNRTFSGYFDTDMFAVTVSTVAVYFLLMATKRESLVALAAGSLTLYLYPFFYRPGSQIVYALGGAFVIYRIVLFRKAPFTWASLLLVSLALAMTRFSRGPKLVDDYLPWFLVWAVAALAILVVAILIQKGVLQGRLLFTLALVTTVVFIVTAAPYRQILNKTRALMTAHEKASTPAVTPQNGPDKPQHLRFKNVVTAIREMSTISWHHMAKRISGSWPGLLLAGVGYVVLCWKFREFVITLPLAGVGLAAKWLGLRFTIYAVPIAALGAVFLILVLTALVIKKPKITVFTAVLAASLLAYPNVKHAWDYRHVVSAVLKTSGVAALNTLSKEADNEDFVITWWDYGSSVWMYSGCQTLNSPASNASPDNYLLSKILTTDSQRQAANLCREAAENFVAKEEFGSAIERILRNGTLELVDPNKFLVRVASEGFVRSPKTRDVYLFLPFEMLPIVPTVYSFSNRDLLTGKVGPRPQYMVIPRMTQRGNIVSLWQIDRTRGVYANTINLDLQKKRAVGPRGRSIPVATFQVVERQKDAPPKIHPPVWFDPKGQYHIVLLKLGEQTRPLVMDTRMLNSLVVQLCIFEKYDPEIFELTARTMRAKVYRVKN